MNMRTWAAGMVVALALSGCGGEAAPGGESEAPEESAAPEETTTPTEAASAAASEDSAGAPTTDEFIEQALVECQAVNEATKAAEPKGDPFGPDATEEDKQQAVEFLATFGESLRTFAGNLEELGYPEENAEAAEKMVSAAEDSADAFDNAAEVAGKNFAKAQAAVGQAFGSVGQLSAAAAEVGIADLENCKRERETTEAQPGAAEVPVVAKKEGNKYVFEFDKTLEAGKTAFVLKNEDDESHFIALVQLTGPGALQKALQAEAKGDSKGADKYIKNEDVGGVEEAPPGGEMVGNVDLKPGTYGMLCFIPGPDGQPHAFNGMAVEFEVQ